MGSTRADNVQDDLPDFPLIATFLNDTSLPVHIWNM